MSPIYLLLLLIKIILSKRKANNSIKNQPVYKQKIIFNIILDIHKLSETHNFLRSSTNVKTERTLF